MKNTNCKELLLEEFEDMNDDGQVSPRYLKLVSYPLLQKKSCPTIKRGR